MCPSCRFSGGARRRDVVVVDTVVADMISRSAWRDINLVGNHPPRAAAPREFAEPELRTAMFGDVVGHQIESHPVAPRFEAVSIAGVHGVIS